MIDSPKAVPVIDALYRISRLVGQTEDPREALRLILAEVVASLRASSASISLVNPDTQALDIEVSHGLPPDSESMHLALGQGITGRAALLGRPIRVNDVESEPHYIPLKPGVRAEMAVPMFDQGTVIGVVNVDRETPQGFDADEEKLLTLLTSEASRVVGRLWHFHQLKEKADQLQALVSVAGQLVSCRESQDVLDAITREARALIDCRLCAIFLLKPDGQTLRLRSLSGLRGLGDYEENLNIEESTVGVAISRKKQIAVFDLPRTEEHHFVHLTQQEGLVSLLATPILYGEEVIGVLNAYTDRLHRFNNDERQMLATLASLGAVAIENSRLYARVFSSEESLRRNERLTTLGLLAAEIAHEIRNPLTVIKLLFDGLDLDYQDDPRQRDVAVIGEKIDQLEEIVGRVLSFGKSRTEMHARFRFRTLVEETLLLVRLKLEQCKISLDYHPDEADAEVDVHKGQIQQVILNLLLNAIKAMPNGGAIRIRLETRAIDGHQQATFTLSDTGGGIATELQPGIFDSFLSGNKRDSGLGLSISKQILKAHHGRIELVQSGADGTTFSFHLPLAARQN